MNRIRLLPEQVANQIAAGEVIERPASVVKELVENALDAQAGRITVEIQAGGRSLIRVTDDGVGMSKDDALLCLERHATSKIQKAEDLAAIATMAGCAPSIPGTTNQFAERPPTRTKSLTIGVTTQLTQMGVFAGQSTGGWTTLNELHSAGLITSGAGRAANSSAAKRPSGRTASIT